MVTTQFKFDVASASASLMNASHRPGRGLSHEEWEQLRPLIRELYLDKRLTLAEVSQYVEQHHGFKPTKKQLLYRISAWGFEKNVKKAERREILKRLGPELQNADASIHLKGRRFDKSKLDRWDRQEKNEAGRSSASTEDIEEVTLGVSSVIPEVTDEDLELEEVSREDNWLRAFEFFLPEWTDEDVKGILRKPQVNGLQSDDQLTPIRPHWKWPSFNVIGSPRLTGLLKALASTEYEDVPTLDLGSDTQRDADISIEEIGLRDEAATSGTTGSAPRSEFCVATSPTSKKAPQIYEVLETWTQPCLHHNNYLLATSPSRTYEFTNLRSSNTSMQVKMSASECKNKLKELEQLQPTEIITLVNDAGVVAQDLYNLNDFVGAEVWFRRTVLVKERITWYRPEQTLWACVRILDCMLRQDRYQEVQSFHIRLHEILKTKLGCEHPVTLGSLELKASLLGALGLLAQEEKVLRQVLQTRLETLGMRHPASVVALENLGYSLAQLKGDAQSQHLLEIAINLRIGDMKTTTELGKSEREIVENMSLLTQDLDASIKPHEGDKVLECAQKLLGNTTTSKSESAYGYHYYRARTYQLQGRMQEAENILRGLLKYHEKSMLLTLNADVIEMLAEILNTTGRQHQATSWLKKLYFLDVKTYGYMHNYTMSSCKKIVFTYAKQRRYGEAWRFLNKAKTEVEWSSREPWHPSDEFEWHQRKFIQEIEMWMGTIYEMDALAKSMAEVSDSEGLEFGVLESEDSDCNQTADIPDPLDGMGGFTQVFAAEQVELGCK